MFDHALAYDVFSILLVIFVIKNNKKKKLGKICRIYIFFLSLGLLDIACILT
jgi:hypothetical protein